MNAQLRMLPDGHQLSQADWTVARERLRANASTFTTAGVPTG
jgi:hypothetical protein